MSEPVDVDLGVLKKKVFLSLAETPMTYVQQSLEKGLTPDRDYIDKRYLTYKSNGFVEEWRWKERLWRWVGPCRVDETTKLYNIDGGFRQETFEGDELVEIQYQNENGIPHRTDGPAVKRFENGKPLYEKWYQFGVLKEQNEPSIIVYYPSGNVKEKTWKRNGELEHVTYGEDGTIQDKRFTAIES